MSKKFIVALVVLSVFATGKVFAQTGARMVDRIVAVVGSQIVKESDIMAAYEPYRAENVAMTDTLRGQILEELMISMLLKQQAIHDSVVVDDADVDNELDRRMRYYIQQLGSEDAFEKFYGKSVESYKFELRGRIRDLIMIQRIQGDIVGGVTVSPQEVKEYYNSLHPDSIPLINSQVEVGQIVIRPPVNEELKEYTRYELENIRQQVIAGKLDFCTAAAAYSDDPGSKFNCGKYENVRRGTFVPEFDAISFSLKDGEYSEVFETEFGFHFMRLIVRKGEEVTLQHILKAIPTAPEDLQKCKVRLDSIMKAVRSDSMTFCEAAAKFSSDENSKFSCGLILNPITGNSRIDMDILGEIDPNPDFPVIVGGLKVGAYSAPHPCYTMDGKQAYRVLWLKSRSEPHKANLKDDYQLIQELALQKKQDEKMRSWIMSKLPYTYIRIADSDRHHKFKYPWMSYVK
jgi:peptidyl-prolyl cis-trans isomerase SurA